jgi:Dolichyl-phosphate-mannose-protein mannosyltransferase
VRVETEWAARRRLECAGEPERFVFSGRTVGRTQQRSDPKSAGPARLQTREQRPGTIVERTLDVTRDDRVPFRPLRHPGIRTAIDRRFAYPLLAVAAVLPRLVVVLAERGDITAQYVDKGDAFARTFVSSGTYGFIPGHPSAYTQPLYGFFLVPPYWIFGRSWIVVGAAHLLVAAITPLLVYEIGRRVTSPTAALLGALAATLHPYLIWHDAHMNREILDHLLAASVVLAVLVAAERRAWPWAALAGALAGLGILGNVRLVLLPLFVAAWLGWRLVSARQVGSSNRLLLGRFGVVAVLLAGAALVVAPWVVRNEVSVGCFALTTDGRALWKANNPATLHLLRTGHWIDEVPPLPGAPITPQDAGAIYSKTGRIVETDECAQMRFYRHRAVMFMREHPGEKAKLAVWGARMLWQPSVTKTADRRGKGTWLDTARSSAEPVFMIALYALAAWGLFLVPRPFAVLVLALLAYNTLAAMLFVGETRYRTPWDFLLAILAGAAILRAWDRVRERYPAPLRALR